MLIVVGAVRRSSKQRQSSAVVVVAKPPKRSKCPLWSQMLVDRIRLLARIQPTTHCDTDTNHTNTATATIARFSSLSFFFIHFFFLPPPRPATMTISNSSFFFFPASSSLQSRHRIHHRNNNYKKKPFRIRIRLRGLLVVLVSVLLLLFFFLLVFSSRWSWILGVTPSTPASVSTLSSSSSSSTSSLSRMHDTTTITTLYRPPIHTLIGSSSNTNTNSSNKQQQQQVRIISNVQFLLDFVIVGFAKCATTSILKWLDRHSEIATFAEEVWSLKRNQPQQLVRRLYFQLPQDTTQQIYRRGYKNPAEITDTLVWTKHYPQWFPKTSLLISIRNPFAWFVSLYNFRLSKLTSLPTPDKLIGPCMTGMKSTCTHKGNYGYHLMRLGKHTRVLTTTTSSSMTEKEKEDMARLLLHDSSNNNNNNNNNNPYYNNYTRASLEDVIVNHYKRLSFDHRQTPFLQNPVWLLHVEELSDHNATRRDLLRRNLANFLHLSSPLMDPLQSERVRPGKFKDETSSSSDGGEEGKDSSSNASTSIIINKPWLTLDDICRQPHYQRLHSELLRLARTNSLWIRLVFLKAPDVQVNSREYSEELLQAWMVDPCENIVRNTAV